MSYDMIGHGQVRCWLNEKRDYKVGDGVPDVAGLSRYVIVLREGGHVRVVSNIISKVTREEPGTDLPLLDKWGEPFGSRSHLSPDDEYFLW